MGKRIYNYLYDVKSGEMRLRDGEIKARVEIRSDHKAKVSYIERLTDDIGRKHFYVKSKLPMTRVLKNSFDYVQITRLKKLPFVAEKYGR